MPVTSIILTLSTLLQLAAVVRAVQLIGVTGRRRVWLLLAGAFTLMLFRRLIALVGHNSPTTQLVSEVIALAISLLLLLGMQRVGSLFEELQEREAAWRRSEEELRASKAQLSQAQHSAHLGSWTLDLATRRIIASDELYRIYGLEPQSCPITPELFLELVHPDDRERAQANMKRLLRESQIIANEYRLLLRDGTVRTVAVTSEGLPGVGGGPGQRTGTVQDITERRQLEARQRAFIDGLRAVLAAADELLTTPDMDTLLRRAVELARERLGLERCSVFLVEEDSTQVRGTYGTNGRGETCDERDQLVDTDDAWAECLRPRRADEARWLKLNDRSFWEWDGTRFVSLGEGWVVSTPIQSAQGPIGVMFNDCAISGAPCDALKQEVAAVYCSLLGGILASRRAGEELHHLTTAARCILWSAIITGEADGGFQWRIRIFDEPAAQQVLPLEVEPGGDYFEAWYQSRHLEDVPRMHLTAISAIRAGQPSFSQEFRCTDRHGREHWMFEDVAVQPDGPERWRAVGVGTDITRLKQAEAELQHAKDHLQAVLDAVPGGVSWIGDDLHYLGANRYLAEPYNLPPEAFIGQDVGFMGRGEEFREFVRHVFESEAPSSSRELTLPFDGEARTFLMVAQKYQQGRAGVFVSFDISERKEAEEKARHDAMHDRLTGLPNRALFADRLSQGLGRARRQDDRQFAVLFLDLDRFKNINDSLGHIVGDQLLVAVAQRLEGCLRPGDTVARLGGDEFVILLDEINDSHDATFVAERIQQALGQAFHLRRPRNAPAAGGASGIAPTAQPLDAAQSVEVEVFTAVSIGIALSASGYERPEEFLRDADIAMYRAKSLGRGRYAIFDTTMHARAVALLALETDLRRAIEREELRLHYQPIVALADGRIAGFEALLRWQHPEHGLIAPGEFIAVAEDTGFIGPIGGWALSAACRQMRLWQEQFPADPPLSISVNLSTKQLPQSDFIPAIERILRESGVAPGSLKLEITESVIMENADSAAVLLERLQALGVQLSLDDFGTGYSSLSYLHRFPIDILKIDRSFISRLHPGDLNQQAAPNGSALPSSALSGSAPPGSNTEIVRTIVALAHGLGISVVAEGVESETQMTVLAALGCDYGQGYFFARPLPVAEVAAFIRQGWRAAHIKPVKPLKPGGPVARRDARRI